MTYYVYQKDEDQTYLCILNGQTYASLDINDARRFETANCPTGFTAYPVREGYHGQLNIGLPVRLRCELCNEAGHAQAACPWDEKVALLGSRLRDDGDHTIIYSIKNNILSSFLRVPKEDILNYLKKLTFKIDTRYVVVDTTQLDEAELGCLQMDYECAIIEALIVKTDEPYFDQVLEVIQRGG